MKMNISIPEMEEDDFEFLPPDIDTELGYDGSKHDWQCQNHVPAFPKSHWTFSSFNSFTFHFCSNCILRKNCPDGGYDQVSMNHDIIEADFIEAEHRLRMPNDDDDDDDNWCDSFSNWDFL